jgi:hypothetical protein
VEEDALQQSIVRNHPGWDVTVRKYGPAFWIEIVSSGKWFSIEFIPGTGAGVSEHAPNGPTLDFGGHDREFANLEAALVDVERALKENLGGLSN